MALLDTASAIMREGDLVDISLSELAARSGLNSALVKYYFGNKAGLLKALLERDMADIVASVDALLAKDMTPEAKFRRHLEAVVDTFFRTPYIHRLLMRMIRESAPDEAQRLADSYLKPLLGAYERIISDGVEAADVFAVMGANAARARDALRHLAASLPPVREESPIDTALTHAFATAPEARDRRLMAMLDAVAGRVLR